MSQHQIILPEEPQILSSIRQRFFPQHKLYRLCFFKSLMNCAPYLKNPEEYQSCSNKTDHADKKAHQNLQKRLNIFQDKYRKNLIKCKNNSDCFQKQLKNFEKNVEEIYRQFYDHVIKQNPDK